MDFRALCDDRVFGVRATGLLVRNQELYLIRSPKGKYYTLGGAIQVGETTEDAVKRELKEEVGVDVEIHQLAFIVENQFELDEKQYHQIEFQYIVTSLEEPLNKLVEGNTDRYCEWIPFTELAEIDLNPVFLKTALPKWDGQLQHVVNKERNCK